MTYAERSLFAFLLLAGAMLLNAQQPQHQPLTAEQKRQIDEALPVKAPVQPKKPRKMLVSNLCKRDDRIVRGHPSIPFGSYALEQMGKRTGAYEVVVSDDIEMFRPEKIKQFDAICFNNTMGVLFEAPELQASLLEFIANGKGFVGIHAAAATFVQHPRYDQWPPFGQMLGGTENGGHPWKPDESITIKIDDRRHPINAVFQSKGFEIAEEVYQWQEQDLRGRLRVLLSIDTEKTDAGPTRKILPVRRKDLDFPMTWIKPHEKGRVFYTAFGHNPQIFWNKELLAHFLAGIQYALGDLDADDTPSGKVASGSNK